MHPCRLSNKLWYNARKRMTATTIGENRSVKLISTCAAIKSRQRIEATNFFKLALCTAQTPQTLGLFAGMVYGCKLNLWIIQKKSTTTAIATATSEAATAATLAKLTAKKRRPRASLRVEMHQGMKWLFMAFIKRPWTRCRRWRSFSLFFCFLLFFPSLSALNAFGLFRSGQLFCSIGLFEFLFL